MNDESTTTDPAAEIARTTGFNALNDSAIIYEHELAELFGKCPVSIKRAVERGELPPSTRFLGKPVWSAGAIRGHIGDRLEAEKDEQEKARRNIRKFKPLLFVMI